MLVGKTYLSNSVEKQRIEVPSPSKTRRTNDAVPHRRLGPQLPPNKTNSPFKAWMQIFNYSICNIVVTNTNAYGFVFVKDWQKLSDANFLDFISVLFLASVQKRRDGPVQWFSANPLLGSVLIKRLMCGKRFSMILKGLHIC